MSQVELEYAVPCAEIAPYVTLFYHFRADVPQFEDTERADHAQFRFNLSGRTAAYHMPDGSVQHAPPIHVIGPTSGAMRAVVEGPVHAFGFGITAGGWSAIIGNDASTMLNRVLDAGALFGPMVDDIARQLIAAGNTEAMAAIGSEMVRGMARSMSDEGFVFVRHVDAWLADSPSPDVADLVAVTGLSRRQVERKCNALYGAPPKLLARKYRALRAAVALFGDKASPADLVAQGFYDQSHLIREIKQFTGLTPRKIKAEPNLLAQLTIAQRSALGGQVSSLISDT